MMRLAVFSAVLAAVLAAAGGHTGDEANFGKTPDPTDVAAGSLGGAKRVSKPGYHLNRLVAKGRAVAPHPLIVTSATQSYLGPFFNLAASMLRARGPSALNNVVLITLDTQLSQSLGRAGLADSLAEYNGLAQELGLTQSSNYSTSDADTLMPIWSFRMYLLNYLVSQGISVLLNDVDAVWAGDAVAKIIHRDEGYDVVASRGAYPRLLGRNLRRRMVGKWGATLCMGFVYFNSTAASIAFLRWALEKNAAVVDDQAWINMALYEGGLAWDKLAHGGSLRYSYSKGSDKPDVGRLPLNHSAIPATVAHQNDVLKVSLQPLAHIDRRCTREEKHAVVIHCNTNKKSHLKEFKARRWNLWFIRNDWEDSLNHVLGGMTAATVPEPHSRGWMPLMRAVLNRSIVDSWAPPTKQSVYTAQTQE